MSRQRIIIVGEMPKKVFWRTELRLVLSLKMRRGGKPRPPLVPALPEPASTIRL